MSFADRLREIVRPAAPARALPPEGGRDESVASAFSRTCPDPADILDGEWRDVRGQRFLVIDRTLPPGHRHGAITIADTLPPVTGAWSRLPLLRGDAPGAPLRGRMLFVDLETTGLAGGAGTYAFLVGCAWYQDGTLRIRQFFLSHFGAERALLEALAHTADGCGAVVTYNGKSFDVPLIETRFAMHRLETPFAGLAHVDMLHAARRLWRVDDGSEGSRLTTMERVRCGFVREGDVPGFEIPSRYFHFVRTGDARAVAAVMEHNRLDLVSLAVLAAGAAQLLEDGAAAATATEALGLAGVYERAGMRDDALASYARAATSEDADVWTRARAWRGCALALRRDRRFDEAAGAWRHLLELRGCPETLVREASEALAVHHEHRLRDLSAARTFALRSLRLQSSASRRQATAYRLARLDRKLGTVLSPGLF